MKTRYLILKKYDSEGKKTEKKYFDGDDFIETINGAFGYESQQYARKALKKLEGKGIFQIEPIYIK